MKIGIFGSSFDPITHGHLVSAWEAAQWVGLDKVIFLPSSQKRKDKTPNISDEHRINMIKLAIENNDKFELDTYELEKNGWDCYTYYTMQHFKEKYPDDEVYFIMGADLLVDLPGWKHGKELVKENKLIVVQRDDVNMASVIMKHKLLRQNAQNFTLMVKGVDNNVSSSFIRDEFEVGRDPKYYMPDAVYNYIKENKLYVPSER